LSDTPPLWHLIITVYSAAPWDQEYVGIRLRVMITIDDPASLAAA